MKVSDAVRGLAAIALAIGLSGTGVGAAADADLTPALPAMTSPTNLAAGGAAIITCLLLLLQLYRRRSYILHWAAGWTCLTISLAIDPSGQSAGRLGAFAAGGSQFLMVASGLCFVSAAHAYRERPAPKRRHLTLGLLTLAAWFALVPLIWGARLAFSSGYLLTAAVLSAAGVAHLLILRTEKLLGAAIVGTALLVAAATNVWLMLSPAARGGPALSDAFFIELALFLVTALGMQLMTFEDMTVELKSANEQLSTAQIELRQLVVTDALTGLRNRRFFDEVIARELNLHRRYGTPLSLLFLDIDKFKAINDTLGHAAGDRTLREVAMFLLRKIRDADYVFRWGGDEFLLLLSCREAEAVRRGLDLQEEFRRSAAANGLPAGVGLSFGCAEVSAMAESAIDALKLADERMYENKRGVRLADANAV